MVWRGGPHVKICSIGYPPWQGEYKPGPVPSSRPAVMPLSRSRRLAWRLGWWFYALCCAPLFRPRVSGRRNVPAEGPVLLLANHTSLMDPPHVVWPLWRPAHFMASEQLFRITPALTALITALNAFPKAKGVKDRASMIALTERYEGGDIVNFYPEGERTWDGRLLPIVPTTARLLKRLEARVIYARIQTGHLNHPRWARWPRWVPTEITYSRLHVYDNPDQPEDEIMADILSNLRIDPLAVRAGWPSIGFRMAEGLPDFLWACPACLAQDTLEVAPDNRSAIQCRRCGARWRVDVSQRLLADGGPAEDTHVATAHDAIVARFEALGSGTLLEAADASLWKIQRGERTPVVIGAGTARLTRTTLGLYSVDGGTIWEASLSELHAVNMQIGNQLQVRTEGANMQLNPGQQSPIKWCHFTRRARQSLGAR